jgi:potassium efflux system protein
MKLSKISISQLFKTIAAWSACLTVILILLCLLLVTDSAAAQLSTGENTPVAKIVFDGNVLFEVSSQGNFTAQDRAEYANSVLKPELEKGLHGLPTKVIVTKQDNSYTIRVNDIHLLSVTESDAGSNPSSQQDRAQDWARKIDLALVKAKEQRTVEYLQQSLLISVVVLVFTAVTSVCLRHVSKKGFGLLPRRFRLFIESSKSTKSVFSLIIFIIQIAIWTSTAYYITDLFPVLRSWRYRTITFIVDDTLDYPILNLGESAYSIADIFNFADYDCHAMDIG